jgi:early endosome antigen 1
MKLSALTENLATVRAELRTTHGKLTNLENIKTEKAGLFIRIDSFCIILSFILDIEARLGVSQEERRVLLERSLASESKNEKLVSENGQLTKKNNDLEAALQELAREYQSLQVRTTYFLKKIFCSKYIFDFV